MIWAQIVEGFNKPIKQTMGTPRQKSTTHKVCKGCGEEKLIAEFYARGEGNKVSSRCKPCYITYQHELQKKRGTR